MAMLATGALTAGALALARRCQAALDSGQRTRDLDEMARLWPRKELWLECAAGASLGAAGAWLALQRPFSAANLLAAGSMLMAAALRVQAAAQGAQEPGAVVLLWPLVAAWLAGSPEEPSPLSLALALLLAAPVARLAAAVWAGAGDGSRGFATSSSRHLNFMGLDKVKKLAGPPRIAVLTLGSRGDVQPFLALATELAARGAKVVVITHGSYRDLVERHGVMFQSVGMETLNLQGIAWADADHISGVVSALAGNMSNSFPVVSLACLKACEGCDAILTTTVTASIGLDIAEKMHVPCWKVAFAPNAPTRAFAPGSQRSSAAGVANLAAWYLDHARIVAALVRVRLGMKGKDPQAVFRTKELGLEPLGGGKRLDQIQRMPSLLAFSQALVPKPRDWPRTAQVTGWWYTAPACDSADSKPRGALEAFLAEVGCAPVCVTFGSMSAPAKRVGVVDDVLEALQGIGSLPRAVVVVDPSELLEAGEESQRRTLGPLDVLVLNHVPHEALFPRCSLVVHHGGAGTTARVLQSCVPSLVVPIMEWTDQPFWAKRVEATGAGFYVPRGPEFPARVREALLRTSAELDSLREGAKRLAAGFDREGGAGAAAELVLANFGRL